VPLQDKSPRQVSVTMLATLIAKVVVTFLAVSRSGGSLFRCILTRSIPPQDMSKPGVVSTESKEDWHISRVGFDSLVLVECRRIGMAGWQPVLSRVL
jgi:hypothetical protein